MFVANLLFFVHIVISVSSESIGDAITNYFDSESVKTFQHDWKKYKNSYDNALRLVLNDVFSRPAIHQHVRREPDFYKLADSYHVTDNVVDLLLERPTLRELPRAVMPFVSFALASNALFVTAELGKMFVDGNYSVLRDESALVYEEPGQMKSPFTYQQVLPEGDLTITAEECLLLASMVLTMSDMKVSVGHSTVTLENCKFHVEIYNPGFKSPPVIAPYFSAQKSKELMRLLAKPIRGELVAKMQGAVLNYPATLQFTNSSGRDNQRALVSSTREYMAKVVKTLNKMSVQQNGGTLRISGLNLGVDNTSVKLKEITVRGLDSAYASHTGGPYKFKGLHISEAITFDRLKVDGRAETGTAKATFTADFLDVSADVTLGVAARAPALRAAATTGWRMMEYSRNYDEHERYLVSVGEKYYLTASAVIAYLSSELPKLLDEYLFKTLPDALSSTDPEVGSQPNILGSHENSPPNDGTNPVGDENNDQDTIDEENADEEQLDIDGDQNDKAAIDGGEANDETPIENNEVIDDNNEAGVIDLLSTKIDYDNSEKIDGRDADHETPIENNEVRDDKNEAGVIDLLPAKIDYDNSEAIDGGEADHETPIGNNDVIDDNNEAGVIDLLPAKIDYDNSEAIDGGEADHETPIGNNDVIDDNNEAGVIDLLPAKIDNDLKINEVQLHD